MGSLEQLLAEHQNPPTASPLRDKLLEQMDGLKGKLQASPQPEADRAEIVAALDEVCSGIKRLVTLAFADGNAEATKHFMDLLRGAK